MLPATQSNTRQNKLVEKATEFVLTYGKSLYHPANRPIIEKFISQHISFGTLLVVWNGNDIIAMCRWNFTGSDTANILDLIIHPDFRNKNVMKSMLVQGISAYPWIKQIAFHRKKHNRDATYLVNRFIGGIK